MGNADMHKAGLNAMPRLSMSGVTPDIEAEVRRQIAAEREAEARGRRVSMNFAHFGMISRGRYLGPSAAADFRVGLARWRASSNKLSEKRPARCLLRPTGALSSRRHRMR